MRIISQNELVNGDGVGLSPIRYYLNNGGASLPYIGYNPVGGGGVCFSTDGINEKEIEAIRPMSGIAYVSKQGSDLEGELGKHSAPFLTFQAAVDACLSAGARKWNIIGSPGTYDELVDLKSANSLAGAGFEFHFHLMAGCELIYTGSESKAVIGKYQSLAQNERIAIHLWGYGVVEYQGTGVGSAIGNRFTDGGNTASTMVYIHKAKTIKSNSSYAIGFDLIPLIQDVDLIESTMQEAINCQAGSEFEIRNCKKIKGATQAIRLLSPQNVRIEQSNFEALDIGLLINNPQASCNISNCTILSGTVGVANSRGFNLNLKGCKIRATNGPGVRLGTTINYGATSQSHIHGNFIICENTSFTMIEVGIGQNAAGTIHNNTSNVDVAIRGNGNGKFKAHGGISDNLSNSNIAWS